MAKNYLPHVLSVMLMWVFIWINAVLAIRSSPSHVDPFERYGTLLTIILYVFWFAQLIPLPAIVGHFIGFLCFNPFSTKNLVAASPSTPFLCFRVVTRGTYPKLVRRNVRRNLEVCRQFNLLNYVIEIVTDKHIYVDESMNVKEVVVPVNYKTSNGSLFKARALNYCLEDGINTLKNNDWIIHLDEETLLTQSALSGIVRFISSSPHHFGQGVITYTNGDVVNWFTTIGDLGRVGADYGILRFTLGLCHRPLFSWKGSFVVAKMAAERDVTFNFSPECCIAEDATFALTAWNKGYTFGLVDGIMWEKSAFTALDYIRQRKRWVKGLMLTFYFTRVPLWKKIGIACMLSMFFSLPFNLSNIILIPVFPIPIPIYMNLLIGFIRGVLLYLFLLAFIMSVSLKRMGTVKCTLLGIFVAIASPIVALMEAIAVCLACRDIKTSEFHIVAKEGASYLSIDDFSKIV